MKKLLLPLFLLSLFLEGFCQEQYMLVGTYDSPASNGIYVYKFDSRTGSATAVSHCKISNASYLSVSPDQQFVFAVNENSGSDSKGGGVTSFSFDKTTGTLTEISHQSSQGNGPCYITIDKTGKWAIAGNYGSGNFSVLPVNKKGELDKAKQVIQQAGAGPDTARQKSPHVHGIFLKKNNTGLYVTDLGTDKIMSYRLDAKKGVLAPEKIPFVNTRPGGGPRHMAFSANGKYIYLLQEMSGTVTVFSDKGQGNLKEIQSVSSVPADYKGEAGSADIHVSPDGKFLYASNRGNSNTIAIFSIAAETGMITWVGHQDVMGKTPRNFNFDPTGRFLLVANQNSDNIVVFNRDSETGLLSYSGNMVEVGKPVCIKWISLN